MDNNVEIYISFLRKKLDFPGGADRDPARPATWAITCRKEDGPVERIKKPSGIKFVISNMLMVTLVIGLAFLAVGLLHQKNSMERRSEQALGEAALMEGNGFLAYPALGGQVRFPYFILITDGQDHVIRVEGQYRSGAGGRIPPVHRGGQPSGARRTWACWSTTSSNTCARPFENGYKITYVDTSLGESFADGMWNSLAVIGPGGLAGPLRGQLPALQVGGLPGGPIPAPGKAVRGGRLPRAQDAPHRDPGQRPAAGLRGRSAGIPAAGQAAAAAQASGPRGDGRADPRPGSPRTYPPLAHEYLPGGCRDETAGGGDAGFGPQ